MNNRVILNLQQAAELSGVCAPILRRMLLSGVVPGMRVGRRWLIPRDDLIRAISERAKADAEARK